MYQVLYRKWRPQTFDDVSGQEHITTTLKNEVSAGRLNHAYLFTGSRGTGKTTCAKILAKAVNCTNSQNGNPCCECEICRGIDEESILDVVEMDAASNRKIEDIRSIIDEVQFKPAKSKYRVYIVDEVHMLTKEAFNALLKTLEEPPEHVIFILATTEIHKLPQTILSRCQRFDFHRIPPRAIADRLLYVAKQEGVELTDEASMMIASVADGALRDALSLLDRCIAISSSVDEDVVRNAAGLARKTYLYEMAASVINKNTAKSLEIIDRLYAESKDMARLCEELLSHFRALMLIKSVRNPKEILVMSEDEFDEAQLQSDYLSLADIVYYMDVLSRSHQRMGHGTADRTELEMAMVKLSSAELDGTYEALTSRITALEKAVKRGLAIAPQKVELPEPVQNYEPDKQVTKPVVEDEPIVVDKPVEEPDALSQSELPKAVEQKPEEKPAKAESKIDAVKATSQPKVTASKNIDEIIRNAKPFPQWVEVVGNMRSISMSTFAAFNGSSAFVSGNYLLIDTDNSMAFDLLKEGNNRKKIKEVILETTGKAYNLGPYKRVTEKQKKQDPLDMLKKGLEDSGVEITEE